MAPHGAAHPKPGVVGSSPIVPSSSRAKSDVRGFPVMPLLVPQTLERSKVRYGLQDEAG